MSLTSLIKKGSRLLGFKISRTVASFGNKLAIYEIKKDEYSIKRDQIFFKKLNVSLPIERALPLLEGYENAIRLSARKDVSFFTGEGESLHVKIGNTQFRINDEEELFILCEVFLEGSYNLLSPTHKKIALIDIGMNVGITSIFYASQSQVDKVFSFEPFTPTFNMALENIKLNNSCAYKVEPYNFGLAKKDDQLQLPFSIKQKGRMGLKGIPENSTVIKNDVAMQSINLKTVSEQFTIIKEKTKEHFVICKMDCEGAEYELIDSLYDDDLLSLPDAYFIEWHYKSPDEIVSKLIKKNYNIINTTFRALNSGMIYALKNQH